VELVTSTTLQSVEAVLGSSHGGVPARDVNPVTVLDCRLPFIFEDEFVLGLPDLSEPLICRAA